MNADTLTLAIAIAATLAAIRYWYKWDGAEKQREAQELREHLRRHGYVTSDEIVERAQAKKRGPTGCA